MLTNTVSRAHRDIKNQDNVSAPVFVSDNAVLSLLEWPTMIEAIRQTYSVPHDNGVSAPRALARGEGGIWMRTLTGVDPAGPFMGVKQFGLSRQGQLSYLISLFDKETGEVVALLDAKSITALRTAATTAVAVDLMAPQGADTLGIVGSGAEATTHARAIHAVRPLKRLTVFSPNPDNRAAFARAFEAETGVPAYAVATAELAVRDQAIVIGATRSRGHEPVIAGKWLTPQTMLASIGATLPEHWEIDTVAIDQAGIIVCDVPQEVTQETKCFLQAQAAGIDFEPKIATLNALVMRELDSRLAAIKYPLYRSVGGPLQDISIATLAYRLAIDAGEAATLPINFVLKS